MKNRKLKYIGLFLLPGIVLLTSCKKFLDKMPVSQPTDQTTFKSDGDANASIAACYSLIRASLNSSISYYAYGDLPTDEFDNVVRNDPAYLDVMRVNWAVSIPASNTYDPRLKLRVYNTFYTSIAQSNRCLYFIGNMPVNVFNGSDTAQQSVRKNSLLGEAYFTRAFNYFYMSRVWGDVPLITEYIGDASTAPAPARAPQKQVLDQCISDLKMAASFLDWQDPSSTDRVVRADRGSVYALMAHVYAWMGDYDSCSLACDQVINSGSYSLVPRANILSIYKGQSPEGIFEIAQNTQAEGQSPVAGIAGQTLMIPYLANQDIPAWEINTLALYNLYDTAKDLRYKNAFVNLVANNNPIVSCIKYSNLKYLGGNQTYPEVVNNIIIFRLAGIMLLKAEALTAKSNPDYTAANAIVNDIRAASGLDPIPMLTGNDLFQAVIDERGRELFLEGHRYYDLVRLARQTGNVKFPFITPAHFKLGKYYWPLDPILFTLNPNLKQTPYWVALLK
jgi:hypothetical protein